jgi:hypothetical protein
MTRFCWSLYADRDPRGGRAASVVDAAGLPDEMPGSASDLRADAAAVRFHQPLADGEPEARRRPAASVLGATPLPSSEKAVCRRAFPTTAVAPVIRRSCSPAVRCAS